MGTSAQVTMTVRVDVGSSWGSTCQINQVEKQAAEEAVAIISRSADRTRGQITIIGKPTVKAIMHTKAAEEEWSDRRRLNGYRDQVRPLTFWQHIRAAWSLLFTRPVSPP